MTYLKIQNRSDFVFNPSVPLIQNSVSELFILYFRNGIMSTRFCNIISVTELYCKAVIYLKTRKRAYGDVNIVGKCVERLRKERGISQKDFISKMQTMGCDINPTSYSKLEGQVRIATDKEIYVIAQILNVAVDDLFEDSESQ